MASFLDGLGLEGSVLDGIAEWPASTILKEWFAITRQLIQETIADMGLDSSSLIFVEGVFRNFARFTFDAEKCVPNYFFSKKL